MSQHQGEMHLIRALIRCAEIAGGDVSDGPPTHPDIVRWATTAVADLRADYDEACCEFDKIKAERDRYREALAPFQDTTTEIQSSPMAAPRSPFGV